MPVSPTLTAPANNRSWFRLSYPIELMPTIVIGFREFAVPEISEHGFRIVCRDFSEFRLGDEVKGTFYFSDGTSMTLTSTVYRKDQREFVLQPLHSIPFKRVLAEQRRVIKRSIG